MRLSRCTNFVRGKLQLNCTATNRRWTWKFPESTNFVAHWVELDCTPLVVTERGMGESILASSQKKRGKMTAKFCISTVNEKKTF